MAFVDLDRYFVPLRENQEPNLDIGRLWGPRVSGWLSWNDLRQRRRVILLAEASSGKTEEFRHQSETLQAEGKPAFFLRIEELDQGIEQALDRHSTQLFREWLNAPREAWFFLDSVDEARLNRKNFDTALRQFAKDLGDASERAHIYVSCRVTDWRGAADRADFQRYLPAWKQPEIPPPSSPDNASGFLKPLFERNEAPRREITKTAADLDELTVVQLVPLSQDQYGLLAEATHVKDVTTFTKAIARQGLAALAERPGDLLDLADYWNTHGKFGPFAKMLEHSVLRKLSEPDPYRPDNEALSSDDALKGAERLAAALTFGKTFTLRAPGSDPDPTLASGALDPADILNDWTPAKRNALLRRGIFAPATYGRIRFHHRSSQEYLAAQWLHRLLQLGCPRQEVSALLFAERYGVRTVVPSLRAEAAWLSLRHVDIREEIIRREPLVLLGYGDPGSLPIEARKQILLAYAVKQATGDVPDDRLENRDLWMFANEELAPTLLKVWSLNPRDDFRLDLLRLIREGAIKGASRLARVTALNEKAGDYHRIIAVQALESCGDKTTLSIIAKRLTKSAEKVTSRLASSFALTLYPRHLSTRDLVTIIQKAKRPTAYASDSFGYQLKDFYTKAGDHHERAALLEGLADLSLSKPFIDNYRRVAKRYVDIARHVHELAGLEIARLAQPAAPPYLVRLLMAVERAGRDGFSDETAPRLVERIRASSVLNRALMWADVAEQRQNGRRGPVTRHWQITLGGNQRLWSLSENDLPWLYDDLRTKLALEDREIALSGVCTVLSEGRKVGAEEARLRAAIGSEPVLLAQLAHALNPPPHDLEWHDLRLQNHFYDLRARFQRAQEKAAWLRFRAEVLGDPSLLSDPRHLTSWKKGIYRLQHLSSWLQQRLKSNDTEATLQWRLLEEGLNRDVAEAFRDGMKQVWRFVRPVRPVKKPDGVITTKWPSVLAFAGIGIEAAGCPDWPAHLTAQEAALAARHGCRVDQSYPEWIEPLILAWPKAVLPALREQLALEWHSSQHSSHLFLYRYASSARPIPPPVQRLLVNTIVAAEASALATLNKAQALVNKLDLDATQKKHLFAVAAARFEGHWKAGTTDFALSYLGLLLMLDPDAALPLLERWVGDPQVDDPKAHAERTFSTLFDRYNSPIPSSLSRAAIATLESLLRLTYRTIRPKDDVFHEGTFTPDTRDHAQQARDAVLSALLDRPGPEAYYTIKRLADDPAFKLRAHRFHELAHGKALRDAEFPPWTPSEIRAFEDNFAAPAKTGDDLLRIVRGVLAEIDRSLTDADFTSRKLLERAQDEDEVQPWLAEQMLLRAKGRFHIGREAEIALGDKPDIIVSSTAGPYQVAVEIKHGGKEWSATQLEHALRVQLAKNYLKPADRRHGVLVVTHHRNRRWQRVGDNRKISFGELMAWLSGIAVTITQNGAGPISVAAAGINAWKEPAPQARKPGKASHGKARQAPRSPAGKRAAKRKSRPPR